MCTILISDDEYLEREFMKKVISDLESAEVVGEVNGGLKAVELSKVLKPDLIFLNNNMGGLCGLKAAKQIRSFNPSVCIVITTSYDNFTTDEKEQMDYLEIKHCLIKPYTPEEMKNIINICSANIKTGKHKKLNPHYKKNIAFYPKSIMTSEIIMALDFIDKNYTSNITMASVAAHVYLSSYYFSRLFKKEVGVTFSNYLCYKKIDEAKRLLQTTNLTIIDISTQLNFKEQNYFCKVFKKIVNQTPKEYRAMSIAEHNERSSIVKE